VRVRQAVVGVVALSTVVALAACGGSGADAARGRGATSTSRRPTSADVPAQPTTTAASTPAPDTTVAVFAGTAEPVTAAELGASWHDGCPVGPSDLRKLHVSYWGFDARPHEGTLVVHADVTTAVIGVFQRLYEQRFPIRRMDPIDTFGGSDPASMDADNTSGFNCRPAVTDGPPQWSVHAYGQAIDVNPVENPYLQGGAVQPAAGSAYLDRADVRPGMAVPGGVLIDAFAAVGWQWGGRWDGTPDYQHFSATGG
jgi:D-alanyl-D-alanine carboxypeptidase